MVCGHGPVTEAEEEGVRARGVEWGGCYGGWGGCYGGCGGRGFGEERGGIDGGSGRGRCMGGRGGGPGG